MRRLMATGFVLLLMLLLAVGIVSAENWMKSLSWPSRRAVW